VAERTSLIEFSVFIRPRPLELGAAEELIALDHVDILQKNGFEIAESISSSPDSDENERRRVNLVAMPVSKSTTFDMKGLFYYIPSLLALLMKME
jgi:DNA mismatch repair protein PMS2